jgi:glycosyltransferase involved in cell wall biosynthesis
MLNGLSVFFLNSFFKIPHIAELHHIEGYPIAVSLKERFYATWGKIYVYFIAKHFNAIRVDNGGAIVSLLKRLGLNESKLIYLPPIYLELEKFRPLNIEKKYDIIFVGRFVENKGIFILLKSILLLKQQNILLKTCLKGRGPLTHSILQFIKDNNLADLVQINQNNLNEKELIEFYNQGKVLVCASTVEGGPRVTFEAMACDVPVITTGCGLMPECIKNGENGFIFDGTAQDLADKLKEIFLDLNLYKKIQVHSRNSVLKYDYKITLEAYATSYRKRIGK